MQVVIKEIKTQPQTITITKKEYNRIALKASLYDLYRTKQSLGGILAQQKLTAEQRKEKAKRAATARWNKKG